jgi:glutathione S-transferase
VILIGQYDSPFVRRVGIAMRLYELTYEHRPWSTFGDRDKLIPLNPLGRVPALVLDDGEVLIESGTILDYLDERVGDGRALVPPAGSARRHALKICALATGLADKAVALFYERAMHTDTSEKWVTRCSAQIEDAVSALEQDRGSRHTAFWFGDALGHADIAVACALRFVKEAHPGIYDDGGWPALAAHSVRCEELEPFRDIQQRFIPPN